MLFNPSRRVLPPRTAPDYFQITPEEVDKERAAKLKEKVAAAQGEAIDADDKTKAVKAA